MPTFKEGTNMRDAPNKNRRRTYRKYSEIQSSKGLSTSHRQFIGRLFIMNNLAKLA